MKHLSLLFLSVLIVFLTGCPITGPDFGTWRGADNPDYVEELIDEYEIETVYYQSKISDYVTHNIYDLYDEEITYYSINNTVVYGEDINGVEVLLFIPYAIEDDILIINNPFPSNDVLVTEIADFNELSESTIQTVDSIDITTNDITLSIDSEYPEINTIYYAIKASSNMSEFIQDMCFDKIEELEGLLSSNMIVYIGKYVNEFGFNRDAYIGIISPDKYMIFSVYDNSTEDYQILFEFETD